MTETEHYGKKEILKALKETTPFNLLDDQALEEISSKAKIGQHREGGYIFRQGENSKKTFYLILSGQARAVALIGGEEAVTTIRNPGDFFGVTVLFSDEPYPVSMVATKDLTCLMISQKTFKKAMADNERFADYFTQQLAVRLKELYKTFTDNQDEEKFIQGETLRKRVSEIYTDNVVTVSPMDSIREVAIKMSAARVSSVVVISFKGKPIGIITEKDLVSKVLSIENPELGQKAKEIMSSELITVHPEDFSYQALLMMIKHNINHIVVTDENQALHGIVTIKDLIRSRRSGALSVVRQIEHQAGFEGLAGVIAEVDQVQQALLTERSYASEICFLISELYDRITRKLIQIAESEMVTRGQGAPPLKYCFINMGSAGRKEQFSRTDQDNGIIYEDPPGDDAATAAEYFLELGKVIVTGLEKCGFARCKGEIMADNPQWCLPLSGWKKTCHSWVDNLDPKNIRNMTIFLDYRYIAGEISLHDDLKAFTTSLFRNSKHALLFMAEDDLRQKVPLNFFGRIVTEKSGEQRKKFDLKGTVSVHLVDCIRIFALREGVEETNTFERIKHLKKLGVFKSDDAEGIETAFESLLMLRIRNHAEKIKQGLPPDNYINPARLTRRERNLLKESLYTVDRLQSLTAHAYHVHKA